MENLLTTYEFQFWTDDFIIIPNNINLNNNLFASPLFLIEFRIQEFLRYLPEGGDSIVEEPRGPFTVRSFFLPSNAVIGDDDDDSICETLSYFGVPQHRMPTVIGGISSFARTMVAQPVNFGRPLLPIVVAIEVNTCNPRDLDTAHRRKYGFIPEIEEKDKPMDKRRRID